MKKFIILIAIIFIFILGLMTSKSKSTPKQINQPQVQNPKYELEVTSDLESTSTR